METGADRLAPGARAARVALYRAIEARLPPQLLERLLRDRWELERDGWFVTLVSRRDDCGFVAEGTGAQGRFGIYFVDDYPALAPLVFHESERLGIFVVCPCVTPSLGSWNTNTSLTTVLTEFFAWATRPRAGRTDGNPTCRCFQVTSRAASPITKSKF